MHWNFEREQKMEMKVRKQIELEKLWENSEYIQSILNWRHVEIDEIEEEMKIWDGESSKLL